MRQKLLRALALIVALATISGCALSAPTRSAWPTPTAVQAAAPTREAAIGTPTPAPPTPTTAPTPTPSALAPVAPATPLPAAIGMVLGDERGVFWADLVSGEILPLLAEPLGAAWALHDQHLALVRGRQVELVDLSLGAATLLTPTVTAALAEARVVWSADGQTLLFVGWVEPDPLADEPRQQVVFQELHREGPVADALVYDGLPAMLLGYDAPGRRALLWRPADDGQQLDVLALSLSDGRTETVGQLAALGELTLGPDGALAALAQSEGGYQIVLSNLHNKTAEALPLEPGAYATQLSWSPDGARLAFVLLSGELYDPEAEVVGVQLYDLASRELLGPLATALPSTSIVGWASDGQSIIVRSQSDSAQYHAAVSPDGSGERLLPLKGAAALLGWLARPDIAPDAAALDAWRGRFVVAADDAAAIADATASFLAGNPDLSLEERGAQLATYYAAAGWPQRAWQLLALDDGLVAAEAPPASIMLASDGVAQIIGQGQVLAAARQSENLLTVIYGGDYGGAQQWSVALLRRQEGQWQLAWQPLGRSDWISTDGAVAFVGEGIQALRVTGSSRGLPAEPFVECESCPLRQLEAIWRLQDAAYVRESSLPANAPLAALHWEMTAPTPYALLYEAVRRMRAGEALGALASPAAAAQLAQLELTGGDVRLMVTRVTADTVIFGPAETPDRYRALVRQGQIESVGLRP